MSDEKKQIDLFSRMASVEFKDSGSLVEPCACIINRTDREVFNVGIGNTNLEAFTNALKSMAYTLDYPHEVSFWLKLATPVDDVDESALKPREWQIDASEVEGRD